MTSVLTGSQPETIRGVRGQSRVSWTVGAEDLDRGWTRTPGKRDEVDTVVDSFRSRTVTWTRTKRETKVRGDTVPEPVMVVGLRI